MSFTRYAIYAAPDGALGALGAAWLGWDAAAAASCAHPNVPGLMASVAEITATPRKYGFHGTLKPPFRLAEGKTPEQLEAALDTFAAQTAAVALESLATARLGNFIAMIPTGPTDALSDLAGKIVREFDGFRAPATPEEIAKRRKSRLTAQQDANLLAWGYPYVFDAFRFHLTLSGQLDENVAKDTIQKLAPLFDPLAKPFILRDLALFGEFEGKQFHVVNRFLLRG
ncbi:MAG: DUF1045 domain-containing protein [Rhodobacteraceae bacterium]|nr:DUF1045 domain-containing protein [Paracoccaceae bacterium]